jgi:predicted DNA-binding transcriptional regulator AlpA
MVHAMMSPSENNTEGKPQAEPRSNEPRQMLIEPQVLNIVPVGRTTLYNMIKAGRFPRGTYVSPNRRVWFADQITAWQNALDEHNPHYDPDRGRGRGRHSRLSVVKERTLVDVSPMPPDTS